MDLPHLKEPKDPPLILKFMDKLKQSGIYKLSKTDELKDKAMNKARKRMMSSNVEGKLDEGRAKEFYKNKRLQKYN